MVLTAHSVQRVLPGGANEPGTHGSHALIPSVSVWRPAAHSVHSVAFVAEKVPVAQGTHGPRAENCPASQRVQATLPSSEWVPGPQLSHAVAGLASWS